MMSLVLPKNSTSFTCNGNTVLELLQITDVVSTMYGLYIPVLVFCV